MPLISRVADKGIVGAIRVVTAIALFAGLGGSALDHLITLTMRAQHGNENHDILLVKKLDIMAHFGLKSPLLKHDPLRTHSSNQSRSMIENPRHDDKPVRADRSKGNLPVEGRGPREGERAGEKRASRH
jgi:hypothetical protein